MLNKPPEIRDVIYLGEDISALWDELGRELLIPFNDRDTLRENISLTNEDKLESVLAKWISNETRHIKWIVILRALQELRRIDLSKKLIAYLEKPEIYRKYISMDDFSGKYNK